MATFLANEPKTLKNTTCSFKTIFENQAESQKSAHLVLSFFGWLVAIVNFNSFGLAVTKRVFWLHFGSKITIVSVDDSMSLVCLRSPTIYIN